MITPLTIFETLKEQNILHSKLSYQDLENTNANILIKINTKKGQFYHIDLLQNMININTELQRFPDNYIEWIPEEIYDIPSGYSAQLNDATIYKEMSDFVDFLDNYEGLVEGFLTKTPEENLENWGEENPLSDLNTIEITIISNYQLKQELKKYSSQKYTSLANYYYQYLVNASKNNTHNKKKALNNIKNVQTKFQSDDRFISIKNNQEIQQKLNEIYKEIEFVYNQYEINKIELPLIKDIPYDTSHLHIYQPER